MNIMKHKDVLLISLGIGILFIMIAPIPTIILDFLLATSFAVSLLILLIVFYVQKPVDLSIFPMILLGTTLYRLSLNVATTRVILLSEGGEYQAGKIIETFGRMVVGDNAVVGIVVFIILVTINFVVITKGAGRIAEVAARFTLDALPGKQMSIDAELNTGLIGEEEAKSRRKEIAKEADFYGAMDGASKFIRGDAIAGILITLVNIIGGILIGVVQVGLPFAEALQTYTVLTIGDGLVGQIPALVVSGAAGLLITRVPGEEKSLPDLIADQLFGKSRPLIFLSISLLVFALIPGLQLPFLTLAGIAGYIAYSQHQSAEDIKSKIKDAEIAALEASASSSKDVPLESILAVEPMSLELGMDLVSLVDEKKGGNLIRSIQRIRTQLAEDLGLMVPPIHVRDNLNIDGGSYRVLLRGEEVANYDVVPRQVLAINPGDAKSQLRGVKTIEPSFGLDAWWIPEQQRIRAQSLGYTVVDIGIVISTHLTEILRLHADEVFNHNQLTDYLERIKVRSPQLVDEVIPGTITRQGVFKVLRNLLKEGVSIRDSQTIMETIADFGTKVKDPDTLTEFVRQGMARHITKRYVGEDNKLDCISFAPDVQQAFDRALQYKESGEINLNLTADLQKRILRGIQSAVEQFPHAHILCPHFTRGPLRKMMARHLKHPPVFLSAKEIQYHVDINRIALITMKGIKLVS
jgi:flagellar biosynthesis protein FlhA